MKTFILRLITLPLIFLCFSYYSYAQSQPDLHIDHPDSHTVVKGDTLWDISARFLKDPWLWKSIWQNNSQIANPHLIYPGDIIRLIFIDGKPVLTVNTPNLEGAGNTSSQYTIKLSPKIRSEKLTTAIAEIPLKKISSFLIHNRVISARELANSPHIIGGKDQRFMLGEGDIAYARGKLSSTVNNYSIYSKGKEYIDPDTKESLGIQAITLGTAQLRATEGDIASLLVTNSLKEISTNSGHRILPNQEREITSTYLPTPPKKSVSGKILNIESGLSQVGRLDIVAINLGLRDGIEQGNILGIFQAGQVVRDRFASNREAKKVKLPNERAGLLMIFKTLDRMSFGIVLEAKLGLRTNDVVSNP
jgi:hypothetical protein